jgi:hypothetical protein
MVKPTRGVDGGGGGSTWIGCSISITAEEDAEEEVEEEEEEEEEEAQRRSGACSQ